MSRFRRIARKCLFVLVAGVTLLALLYALEDWRGARAWATTHRELEAKGESFDLATYLTPPMPDDQNLAMAPLFARVFHYQVDPQTHLLTFARNPPPEPTRELVEKMPFGQGKYGTDVPKGATAWNDFGRLDLSKWQDYYRHHEEFPHLPAAQAPADDVLLALTRYAPMLDELAREAAARPLTRFPVNWNCQPPWDITLPHCGTLQKLSRTLSLRAIAGLAAGRNEDALRDVELCFRLRQAASSDPTLVNQLVSMSQTGLLLQPIYEGLADRRWSAAELDRLRAGLREMDFLADYVRSIRGCERYFLCASMDELQSRGHVAEFLRIQGNVPRGDSMFSGPQAVLVPAGWFDQNKAVGCRYLQTAILETLDPVAHRVFLGEHQTRVAAHRREWVTPYTFFVRLFVPVFDVMPKRVARTQSMVDEAMLACALERYALDHQSYPDRLDDLVPTYCERIPIDIIDGAPLRYRRTADGRFLLYAVGWNSVDDGGTPSKGPNLDNAEDGDWVWRYPATAQAPAANDAPR